MGSNQSTRATHFHRHEAADPTEDLTPDHHINISNKMVERLVEDATITNEAASGSSNPRGDYKEKVFIEKLKSMDDKHSERCGLTVEELNALVTRVEMRTSHMANEEPVCEDIKDKIIECYDTTEPSEVIKCWDTIGVFTRCVQEVSAKRLVERTMREAEVSAQRSRRVARAREYALRDLASNENK